MSKSGGHVKVLWQLTELFHSPARLRTLSDWLDSEERSAAGYTKEIYQLIHTVCGRLHAEKQKNGRSQRPQAVSAARTDNEADPIPRAGDSYTGRFPRVCQFMLWLFDILTVSLISSPQRITQIVGAILKGLNYSEISLHSETEVKAITDAVSSCSNSNLELKKAHEAAQAVIRLRVRLCFLSSY